MSYTTEQIMRSAATMVGKTNAVSALRDTAVLMVNDGLEEIQRRIHWYRLTATVTFPADQNYYEWITGAGDYLDLIKLINVWNSNDMQQQTIEEQLKHLSSDNASLAESTANNTMIRTFALVLFPTDTFGTVYLKAWPNFTSATSITVEYATKPPAIADSPDGYADSVVNAPRDCMRYYLAWRIALWANDAGRINLFKSEFESACLQARHNLLATRSRNRSPRYGSFFADVRKSRR